MLAPKWRYTDCPECGILVRAQLVPEHVAKQQRITGLAYAAVCPTAGCGVQVSICFAPPSPIVRPNATPQSDS